MGDTEENTPNSSCSIDSSLSLIQENNEIPEKEECVEVEDYRISCSSEANLNKIMKIVAMHVETFAKSVCSEDTKMQFASRALEVFKDCIQDNVTLKGLPYAVNAECLSLDKKEVQYNETKDALLADLSKKIEVCASKRKECPKNYCRILDMRLRHEKHNLKRAKVKHGVQVKQLTKQSFQVDFPSQNLNEASKAVKSSQIKIKQAVRELKEVQKNLNFAQDLISQPYVDALHDTGYNSS